MNFSFSGRMAALNMLEKNKEVDTVPFFFSMQYGKSIRYAGMMVLRLVHVLVLCVLELSSIKRRQGLDTLKVSLTSCNIDVTNRKTQLAKGCSERVGL
jgi:hypothetical protein